MKSIGPIPIDGKIVRPLDMTNLKVIKASPEMIAAFEQAWKDRFRIPAGPADNDPSNLFAEVKVNGQTVAKLYNSGGAEMSNAGYGKVADLRSMGEHESRTGPVLAKARAEDIARALGGTVVMADTAQTQSEWNARPPMRFTYDYAAMEKATQARDARIATTRTLMDAQLIGQTET